MLIKVIRYSYVVNSFFHSSLNRWSEKNVWINFKIIGTHHVIIALGQRWLRMHLQRNRQRAKPKNTWNHCSSSKQLKNVKLPSVEDVNTSKNPLRIWMFEWPGYMLSQISKGRSVYVKRTPRFPLTFPSPPAAAITATCSNQKEALIIAPFSR